MPRLLEEEGEDSLWERIDFQESQIAGSDEGSDRLYGRRGEAESREYAPVHLQPLRADLRRGGGARDFREQERCSWARRRIFVVGRAAAPFIRSDVKLWQTTSSDRLNELRRCTRPRGEIISTSVRECFQTSDLKNWNALFVIRKYIQRESFK